MEPLDFVDMVISSTEQLVVVGFNEQAIMATSVDFENTQGDGKKLNFNVELPAGELWDRNNVRLEKVMGTDGVAKYVAAYAPVMKGSDKASSAVVITSVDGENVITVALKDEIKDFAGLKYAQFVFDSTQKKTLMVVNYFKTGQDLITPAVCQYVINDKTGDFTITVESCTDISGISGEKKSLVAYADAPISAYVSYSEDKTANIAFCYVGTDWSKATRCVKSVGKTPSAEGISTLAVDSFSQDNGVVSFYFSALVRQFAALHNIRVSTGTNGPYVEYEFFSDNAATTMCAFNDELVIFKHNTFSRMSYSYTDFMVLNEPISSNYDVQYNKTAMIYLMDPQRPEVVLEEAEICVCGLPGPYSHQVIQKPLSTIRMMPNSVTNGIIRRSSTQGNNLKPEIAQTNNKNVEVTISLPFNQQHVVSNAV